MVEYLTWLSSMIFSTFYYALVQQVSNDMHISNLATCLSLNHFLIPTYLLSLVSVLWPVWGYTFEI